MASDASEGEGSAAKQADPSRDLNVTPAQYEKRFNQITKAMGEPYRIKLKVEKGAGNDVFNAGLINDRVTLVGTVNKKTGKVSSVTLIDSGDGTAESSANIILAAIATLAAAVPNGTAKTIGPEVLALMKDYNDESREPTSRRINDVTLFHWRSEDLGAWFGAESA
ncbi:hypothetical protein SAMN05444172_9061 [Burkholderia sp. GAS332]|nr:hypothetical protein SAMN05444172_9061 [Burkholderia sp. GAS332]